MNHTRIISAALTAALLLSLAAIFRIEKLPRGMIFILVLNFNFYRRLAFACQHGLQIAAVMLQQVRCLFCRRSKEYVKTAIACARNFYGYVAQIRRRKRNHYVRGSIFQRFLQGEL